jgi:hypothetical protein
MPRKAKTDKAAFQATRQVGAPALLNGATMKVLIFTLLTIAGTAHAAGTIFSTILSGNGQECGNFRLAGQYLRRRPDLFQ